ncbi:MAG: EAL domain-containing protein [Candidatus Nitrotoga sp.]
MTIAKDNNDGASDIGDLNQLDRLSQHKDELAPVRDEEASILNREKLLTAREETANLRENAADLREDATHLREGALTSREREVRAAGSIQTASDNHIIKLQQANAHLVVATIEAHKLAEQVEATKVQLDHLAHHDVLTGLPNRILLQDRLVQAIELACRQGRQLAVMFLDLDHFKHINDSLGHAAGDKLLQSVAQRLLGCVRHSDTISRQGGDEFMVLLPYIEHAESAALCAQKMVAALALPHRIDQHELHISVSIGISIYPDDGQDAEAQIKNADTAMYFSKENGRNNYKFFKQDMNDRAVQRQSIEAGLRRALERQEFVLHYQPKINLKSGVIVGVEALIRWQHPEQGLLPPAQFISIAEDSGLILSIGRWVLREACLQARSWQQAGLPSIIVAVNISALEFRAKDFLDNIRQVLEETGLEPRYLELELTESVLMHDAGSTDSILHALANLGVKLAIDDFGMGYSSLSNLRKFPINTLKVDQSFVSQMCSNPDDAAIIIALINMGRSLKLRIISEGVESSEQAAFLLAQHCDEGQGYYFGRPMVAEALATLLQTGVTRITN